jgi:hypothetical protein
MFMDFNLRSKHLVSQHVEVALVYKAMLGLDEAMAYLEREGVARDIADRVLLTDRKRGQPAPTRASFFRCRRKNLVHDAVIEAALKIEKRFGTDYALALLQQESVPEAVVTRVIAQGPRQIRSKRPVASLVIGAAVP